MQQLSRRRFLYGAGGSIAAAILARGAWGDAPAAPAAKRPNVILILADDFGYECVGANGGTSYETPVLDELAATGVRFEHCYAQPLCTPTRIQLMTGLYNVRNYDRFGEMDPKAATFANDFKKAGYATAIAGKWQLGVTPEAPRNYGFDEAYLWQHTRQAKKKRSRYVNPGLEINGVVKDFGDGEYGPDLVNEFAIDFVTRKKDQPFLLYYPMMLTHDPFVPTPDSADWDPKAAGEGKNAGRHFADMTRYMDKLIGKLVAKLEELSIRENTIIIFLGDNGTAGIVSKANGRSIKGAKGETTAAGMHVPLIVNWPAGAAQGKVCRDLVDSTDFYPTIGEAAGLAVPEGLDGRSFLAQVKGEVGTSREAVYCWYLPQKGPVRECAFNQRFKLYRNGDFFNLQSDWSEQKPLAEEGLAGEARAARAKLQQTLDSYKDESARRKL